MAAALVIVSPQSLLLLPSGDLRWYVIALLVPTFGTLATLVVRAVLNYRLDSKRVELNYRLECKRLELVRQVLPTVEVGVVVQVVDILMGRPNAGEGTRIGHDRLTTPALSASHALDDASNTNGGRPLRGRAVRPAQPPP